MPFFYIRTSRLINFKRLFFGVFLQKVLYLMKKRFPKIVQYSIISVYLIFLAGSVVRMTGSGMGCPDWPKCFGYYIPPTSEEQITWKPNTEYKKGIIIIKDEALFVADKNITTADTFTQNCFNQH